MVMHGSNWRNLDALRAALGNAPQISLYFSLVIQTG
jgi:hypothetical protein